MKLSDRQKKIIDIIQWICIIFLLMVCITGSIFKKSDNDFIKNTEYQKEQTYVKIYESQTIESLKKENRELYDSIKRLNDVESAIEIRYKYKYVTDTITKTEFVYNTNDSVYHYHNDNDTITCDIDVKANNLEWIQNRFTINDRFMIINREKDGMNQTFIKHGENTTVDAVDTWHRIEDKQKWYKNFHLGIQAGFGYGVFNRKPDIFIGVGVSYDLK